LVRPRAPRAHISNAIEKERVALDGKRQRLKTLQNDAAGCSAEAGIAFLFGSERFGMANEDVYRCHVALSIPTNPRFWLAQPGGGHPGHCLRMAPGAGRFCRAGSRPGAQADAAQVAGMLAHWEQALIAIGFLDPAAPKKLMPRLNQLFNRAQLAPEEIHILRGVAKAMIETAQSKR
jgi:tRNA/rRNA methyltransferase